MNVDGRLAATAGASQRVQLDILAACRPEETENALNVGGLW